MSRKVFKRIYNKICRRRLLAQLPGVDLALQDYSKVSATTGTQWITLWFAVRSILRYKPRCILECGTGASTLVLAAAVQRLRNEDPEYDGRIVSMESVKEWFDIAQANLPDACRDVVKLIHGPREKYEVGMFRGYIHGNIPEAPYDFVFLDGPNFRDENGTAFCADVFRAFDLSPAEEIRGVIDGRASSAFVMQTIFGLASVRYFLPALAATFSVSRLNFHEPFNTTDFSSSVFGRLTLKKFRRQAKRVAR